MTKISLLEVEEVEVIMISSKRMSADHKVGAEEVKDHKTTLKFMHHKEAEEEEAIGDQTSSKLMHIDKNAGAGVVMGHKTTQNLNRADQEVEERIEGFKINLMDLEAINEEVNLILNSKELKRSTFRKKMNL